MESYNLLRMYNFLNTNVSNQHRNIYKITSNFLYKYVQVLGRETTSLHSLNIGSICCKWCLNIFSPRSCTVTLYPQKHPKRHLRSLMKKDISFLNSFQKKLIARIKNKGPSNTMVIKCHFCSKTTSIIMNKPVITFKAKKSEEIKIEDLGKKKKKKKKDVFAGLNIAAVQSVKNSVVNPRLKQSEQVKPVIKKSTKKVTAKDYERINQLLSQQPPIEKKKPSLLATFLENM